MKKFKKSIFVQFLCGFILAILATIAITSTSRKVK